MYPSNNNVQVRVRHVVIISFLFCLYLVCQQVQGQGHNDVGSQQIAPPNERFYVETERNVRVTTAVPTVSETLQIFGVSLYTRNIQPVWVQIENLGEEKLMFLPTSVDEAYFTPIETSYRRQDRITILDWALTRDYYDMNMGMYIEPGESRSGYIFTRIDEGTKSFNVDIISEKEQFRMSFFVPVPGLRVDHYNIDWEDLYAKEEIRNVDLDGLIAGLEALPCCTTDKKAKSDGDPLNIAIVGNLKDVYYAFMRAGWDETETIYHASLWKTMISAIGGSEYRYSPISALYVYDRAQDAALQKARANIHQRNHLRLWMTPMRFEDKPVWIGQISRDIGV
ncbi:MAG: LssY C-terminal domain-containing protein, partial [Gammaproteobacteria bacterium]